MYFFKLDFNNYFKDHKEYNTFSKSDSMLVGLDIERVGNY